PSFVPPCGSAPSPPPSGASARVSSGRSGDSSSQHAIDPVFRVYGSRPAFVTRRTTTSELYSFTPARAMLLLTSTRASSARNVASAIGDITTGRVTRASRNIEQPGHTNAEANATTASLERPGFTRGIACHAPIPRGRAPRSPIDFACQRIAAGDETQQLLTEANRLLFVRHVRALLEPDHVGA